MGLEVGGIGAYTYRLVRFFVTQTCPHPISDQAVLTTKHQNLNTKI